MMSNALIILQLLLITICMIMLGMVLNRILGLKKANFNEFKEKALNIQERLKKAQVLGDIRLMAQVQRETMQFTKQIMLKQFIPLCLRCIIFIGIFSILSFFYSGYASGLLSFNLFILGSGWVAIYFLFSITLSLIIFGIKKLIKKITGKKMSSQNKFREIMQIVSPREQLSGVSYQPPGASISNLQKVKRNVSSSQDGESEESSSWKDRLQQ
ncbi:hypothetical protein LCGC14_1546660 [marine sediment metagenome]|uniref:DUF106 domain-containing protein n=1 Tax=marine sediment metagenome TaxID=412755 RepID=A0A0F9L7M8_9ZZZZ|nr:MAG: hypothetical protein Lokiarch_49650 [Candidatus Lokiarchaeum sp. GC14_75]HEA70559.1 hypothetical protein [archaeon]